MKAASIALLGLALAAVPAAAQHKNLSGHWVIKSGDTTTGAPGGRAVPGMVVRGPGPMNPDSAHADSAGADSTRDSLPNMGPPATMGEGGERGEMGEGGERGEGRQAPRRRNVGPKPKQRRQLGVLFGMAEPVKSFDLAQNDTAVTITNNDGFSYTIHPDGHTRDITMGTAPDTLHLQVKADWKDGHLVIEWKPDGGGKMTETYALADSGIWLRLETTIEYKGVLFQPVWRMRMYHKSAS